MRRTPFSIPWRRLLGLGRPTPTTRLGRLGRRVERGLLVLVVLYLALHAYPQVLFAHSLTAGDVTVYARAPLPPETADRIAEAVALVARSELAAPGRRERIFLCDRPWLYRLFNPPGGSFAGSVPMTDHIFIADADIRADLARSGAAAYGTRSLSAVFAHEITHGLIRRRLGVIRARLLPEWVAEGYCDYVAGEGSFPEADGLRRFLEGDDHPSPSYRYFVARRLVAYLIDDRGLGFDEVARRAGAFEAVAAEARGALWGHRAR